MEIKGKIIQILPIESGVSKAGKEWKKGSFILETEGQYPKKVKFDLFGKALENAQIAEGMDCEVSFDVSSREYKNPTTGKVSWFTEASAYRVIQVATVVSQPPQPTSATPTLDSMGVTGYQQPTNQTPPQGDSDLPF